jgi:hypothetical protein
VSIDPAQWSWARLLAWSAAWVLVVAGVALALYLRAMEQGKETNVSGGDFVTVLPYGTRHLAIAVAIALLPPLLAALRKVIAG